jgi:hypothetical protein
MACVPEGVRRGSVTADTSTSVSAVDAGTEDEAETSNVSAVDQTTEGGDCTTVSYKTTSGVVAVTEDGSEMFVSAVDRTPVGVRDSKLADCAFDAAPSVLRLAI